MEAPPWHCEGRSEEEAVVEWEPRSESRDFFESATDAADSGAIF